MGSSNQDIAEIFFEIAIYLRMQDIPFKPQAYEKAAEALERSPEEARDIYRRGGLKALEEIPGVGVSIAEKIEEYLKTGRIHYYESLKKKVPVKLRELMAVEGLGPKSIEKLYKTLGIKDLKMLQAAAKKGKIAELPGFGKKKEENIMKGIEFLARDGGRFFIGRVLPKINEIESRLAKIPGVQTAIVAGSIRRRKETVGDADILVVAKDPGGVMDYFVAMPEVAQVHAHGPTKSAVKLVNGLNVDLRVVPAESYGAALNYFTGSKEHNVALRERALKKGYTLNEYGLFRGTAKQKGVRVAGKTEEELYKALWLDYIEPEMRENRGEIELAAKHALPKLIGYDEILGDLQVQTDWTDGSASIEAMTRAAAARGLKYIAITDHTKRLSMTHGLDEKRLLKQMADIDRVNKKFAGKIKVLKGSECDILKDGSLDIADAALAKLDVVGISVHSFFGLSRKEQTERILRAMRNPHADILFHPTGRIVGARDAYDVDIEAVIDEAKKTGTILEANASERLDLKDEYIRMAVKTGVKIAIDSDAHSPAQFDLLPFGIAQARRGWVEKKDVVNAYPLEKFRNFLKKGK